ncbi:MAG: thiamine pyrophosphate-binding protein [Desulfobacteraceae bacterium]|nr:MAG: thiamine pyrophosphate-binding protein [Desulfobacteraceae bacterium]
MSKANDKFWEVVIEAGIDHVFGMPGGGTIPLWGALADKKDKIRAILARHEGGAACMADMYGRLTGKPGILLGQGLWIGTSGGYGMVESYLAGVPMVAVCDVSDYNSLSQFGPYQNATGDYGGIDLPNIFKSMTKFTTYATKASELVHGLQLAIKHAVTGRPGPTCVLFRMAAASTNEEEHEIKPVLHPLQSYLRVSPPCISGSDAGKIADMLMQARHPVIVAGAGIHRSKAYSELQTLAELLGLPVATTYMGKSALAETHPLCVGTMGVIGQKIANQKVVGADLILALGSCLAPDNTVMLSSKFIDPKQQRIVQIDIEPLNIGWTFPVELGVTADLKIALRQIAASIRERAGAPREIQRRMDELDREKKATGFNAHPDLVSEQVPIAPERVVHALNAAVQPDDIVVLDAGNNRMWMAHHFVSKKAGQVVAAGGAAGVGYGVGACLAAQLVEPNRRVVCVCGDGGMMMHLYVLEMAKEYRLPVTFVVMNNACLGNVMDYQAQDKRIASQYSRTDFAKIARGFDVRGYGVTRPEEISPALEEALALNEPAVVDIDIADYAHFKLRGR